MLEALNTSKIPELDFVSQWLLNNDIVYNNVLHQYTKLLSTLVLLSKDDIDSIRNSKKILSDKWLAYNNSSDFQVNQKMEMPFGIQLFGDILS